jgi:hypothetical protein
MEKIMRRLLGTLAFVLLAGSAGAQAATMSAPGKITLLRTGWNSDSFAIFTNAPFVNPAHCSTPDGYISTKPAAGYNTYYDAAKLGFEMQVKAVVIVDDTTCVSDRPKIIGINLQL